QKPAASSTVSSAPAMIQAFFISSSAASLPICTCLVWTCDALRIYRRQQASFGVLEPTARGCHERHLGSTERRLMIHRGERGERGVKKNISFCSQRPLRSPR